MKTLANCTPREFLKQTNRIRMSVERWLTVTKILEIRERMPEVPEPTKVENKEELRETIEARKKAYAEQVRKNLFDMIEAMCDTDLDGTLELLALVCFIEPKDIDNYKMSDLLFSISELTNDAGVISFFGSLVKLGQSSMGKGVNR